MTILRRIYSNILIKSELPEQFFGGVKGKSPYKNALVHAGALQIMKIDLKRCFQNITHHQVFNVWHKHLKCSPTVSHIATRLTTYHGHLPTGAPTSTTLANLVVLPAVNAVTQIAKGAGLKNSQFIDDSNISGDVIEDDLSLQMRKEFTRRRLSINRKKTKLLKSNVGVVVTGFSSKKELPRLPKKVRKQIRTELHQLKRLGHSDPSFKSARNRVRGKLEQLKVPHPVLYKKSKELFTKTTRRNKRERNLHDQITKT